MWGIYDVSSLAITAVSGKIADCPRLLDETGMDSQSANYLQGSIDETVFSPCLQLEPVFLLKQALM